jgi:acyl-CoA synthetase (NDP forming)
MAPLAGFARVMNPFDIGAAGPTTIEANLGALAGDPGTGALLFYLTPTPTERWRQALADGVAAVAACHPELPVLVVSPAPISTQEAAAYAAAGVPVVGSLLDAVVAVSAAVRSRFPHRPLPPSVPHAGAARVREGRALSEPGSKAYLLERGVPFPAERLIADPAAARTAATEIGYPVVLKAAGAGLTHKSEHGLVVVGVDDGTLDATFADLDARGRALDPDGYEGVVIADQVGEGVEMVVGVTVDPSFGPMVLLGSGGVLTELIADVAVAPAPLSADDAAALVQSTKVARLLAGYRGSPARDVGALVDLLVRVSRVAATDAENLEAIDLNPVRVLPVGEGVAVLDALVVRR